MLCSSSCSSVVLSDSNTVRVGPLWLFNCEEFVHHVIDNVRSWTKPQITKTFTTKPPPELPESSFLSESPPRPPSSSCNSIWCSASNRPMCNPLSRRIAEKFQKVTIALLRRENAYSKMCQHTIALVRFVTRHEQPRGPVIDRVLLERPPSTSAGAAAKKRTLTFKKKKNPSSPQTIVTGLRHSRVFKKIDFFFA